MMRQKSITKMVRYTGTGRFARLTDRKQWQSSETMTKACRKDSMDSIAMVAVFNSMLFLGVYIWCGAYV